MSTESLKQAAEFAENFQLEQIRLIESHCNPLHLIDGKLPPHVKLPIEVQSTIDKANRRSIVTLSFTAEGLYEADQEPSPSSPILIKSRWVAVIQLSEKACEEKDETLVELSNVAGLQSTWPYWRKFVQDSTTQMGLPPLTIPFLNMARVQHSMKSEPWTGPKKSVATKKKSAGAKKRTR